MTDVPPISDPQKAAGAEVPAVSANSLSASYDQMMRSAPDAAAAHPTVSPAAALSAADTAGGAGRESGQANRKLEQTGILTGLKLDSPADKERLVYLQTTMQNFMPAMLAAAQGQPGDDLTRIIDQRQKAIQLEQARGEFGPETKAAYGQYVDWLQNTAIPSALRDLKYFNLPADDPSARGLKAPPADLKINIGQVPDDKQLQRLDDAVRWAQSADNRAQLAKAEVLKKVDGDFVATVKRLHLPSGWIADIDNDHNRWRRTVGPLIDGALTARSNIEILDELHKAGGPNTLAGILPADTLIRRDADDKIKSIHLSLPQGWDLNQSENKRRADQLQSFLAETNAILSTSRPQLQTIASHPERALAWGDQEVSGMKGKFDGQGNFLGLIDKSEQPGPGQHCEDVNLLSSRYSIEHQGDKIVVHQEVQAKNVPWWGYQNLIGVKDVGNKISIDRTYSPSEDVVVRTTSGYEVKEAQDLATYKNWQMAMHYGEKTLMGTLDVGLTASGMIEAGTAFKAARVAGFGMGGLEVLGRDALSDLVLRQGADAGTRLLTSQAGTGLLRTTIGAAGLFNNAGARESTFGQTVNTARSVYFLADAGIGLGSSGVKAARAVRSVFAGGGETSLSAGRVTLAGLTAGSKTDMAFRGTSAAFKISELLYIPVAGVDLTKGLRKLNNDQNAHVVRAAEIVANDQPKDRP